MENNTSPLGHPLGSHGGIYTPAAVLSSTKLPVPSVPTTLYNYFDTVHVALISWKCEPPVQADIPELEGEVAALHWLFESRYGFLTQRIRVTTSEKHPLRFLVRSMEAVCEGLVGAEGERKLLIVGYGGHGSKDGWLAATSQGPSLRWSDVQKTILEGNSYSGFAKLFLLDCCFAGLAINKAKSSLQKMKKKHKSDYSLPAAVDWICAADSTHVSYSEWSFTKELIEALDNLGGGAFTADSLMAHVRNTRMYRAANTPETYVHASWRGTGTGFGVMSLKGE